MLKRRKEKKMKYRIQEECGGARLSYDDRFDTIEEALEVVREYQNEDEGEDGRQEVTYSVVNEKGELAFRVTPGVKYVVHVIRWAVETAEKTVTIDDIFEEASVMMGAFDTLEEARKLYATLPAGDAREIKLFGSGYHYLHTGKFIEECEYNSRGEFIKGSNVWDIDVPDYEEKE